jgi:hypothetical protein
VESLTNTRDDLNDGFGGLISLREGQTLNVAITDIDRAGRLEPWDP